MSNITAKGSAPETKSNGNDNPVSDFQATNEISEVPGGDDSGNELAGVNPDKSDGKVISCLLYTSPSPRDLSTSRMPSSA